MSNIDNTTITVPIDSSLKELTEKYLANRLRDMAAIRVALAQYNFETIRAIGHNIKGTGSGYGFDFISKIGDELEQAALRADVATITSLTSELTDYIKRLKVVFD